MEENDWGSKLRAFLWLLLAMSALWFGYSLMNAPEPAKDAPYSELLERLHNDEIAEVHIRDTQIVAELKPTTADDGAAPDDKAPARIKVERLPRIDETELIDELTERGVKFSGHIETTGLWSSLLLMGLPLLFLVVIMAGSVRAMRGGGGMGPMSFGKDKAKIHDESKGKPVTFEDVAGVDEARAELMEVVDFLKHPDKYRALGAQIPKGVLLVGPPGTGKTLLARAVAGEAGVPFFSITGSAFVEMFVGVGAARMRSLFEQAKARAPCIVFIDEIDAVGKSRGGIGAMGTNDEREQTLNQLLAELDGFEPTGGVVLMAATNRPEVLDPALMRAGRFDRQVVVDRPDVIGREAILKVHARKASLSSDVDLKLIAKRTPGMSGADLARVVNEAALAGARRTAKSVQMRDFDEAIDRIQLGLKKQGQAMTESEKRRVAYHEAGHTLVAITVEHGAPVHRVSIIPRSIGALGVTLQLPDEERRLATRKELVDRLCTLLGGRAAEQLVCDDVSTGAENDLEQAAHIARLMITRYGMNDEVGPVSLESPRSRFLEEQLGLGRSANMSEELARVVDTEVRGLLTGELERALGILMEKRETLEAIAAALLERETLDRAELDQIVAAHGASAASNAVDAA